MIFLFFSIALFAQDISSQRIDFLKEEIGRILSQKDSFYQAGLYERSYQSILAVDSLSILLQDEVYNRQDENLQYKLLLLKKEQDNQVLLFKKDRLILRNNLAQTRNNEITLEKVNADKRLRTQKVQQHFRVEQLHARLEKEKNKEIESRLHYEKELGKNRLLVSLIAVMGLLSILMIIWYILHEKSQYARQLQRQKQLSDKARQKARDAKAEAEIACEEAEKANAMKTVFIQNMSHEIRTPLNAIVGFSNILTDHTIELNEASKQEFSTLIETNSEMLTTLINDILDFSNLVSGKYKMNYALTSVQEIGRMALLIVKYKVPHGVDLSFDIPEGEEDLKLWTDGSRVKQVLINYFTNACKNTTQGSIRLKYDIIRKPRTQQPLFVRYSVTDTGVGVPPEKAETIFKRFEKLDDFKQGNGLGLNICRTIAERLDAKCWLDTTYHQGARFYFEMPVLTEKPE